MKKILFLFILFCISSFNLKAQKYEDVVYLKNGGIIHGTILEKIPNKTVKIQTKDRNVFVFKILDVDKITKELIEVPKINLDTKLNPNVAFLWSILVPGAGQFYNEEYTKGFVMLGISAVGYGITLYGMNERTSDYISYDSNSSTLGNDNSNAGNGLIFTGMVIVFSNYIWSIIDAGNSARRINKDNGFCFNYKINQNIELALKPDYKIDNIRGNLNPVFGAKLSFSLH